MRLTGDDLAVVRPSFDFQRMRAYDFPTPDLQVAAGSAEQVRAGDFRLVLGEIHHGGVLWHNASVMWCDDVATFAR